MRGIPSYCLRALLIRAVDLHKQFSPADVREKFRPKIGSVFRSVDQFLS